jgi:DNA-binding winged helix-turn-helix (wHTH) protein
MKPIHVYPEQNYPFTYREDVVGQLRITISQGESCFFLGMKDNQKTNVLRFITHRQDIHKHYGLTSHIFLLFHLNELPQPTVADFYRFILTGLLQQTYKQVISAAFIKQIQVEDPLLLFTAIKDEVTRLIAKTGKKIIFVLNNFELMRTADLTQISRNLFSLNQVADNHISCIFTGNRPFSGMQEVAHKVIYMTPFTADEAEAVVRRNLQLYGKTATVKQIDEIIELSGGHAGTIKFMVQNFGSNYQAHPDICFQYDRLLAPLTGLEVAKLKSGIADPLLLSLGMQVMQGETLIPFAPLLIHHLQQSNTCIQAFCYDQENREIFYYGKPLSRLLTPKEWSILTTLMTAPKKEMVREELMVTVWGERHYPSDWAFDKLISRLRHKLYQINPNQDFLITHRNQGIRLI